MSMVASGRLSPRLKDGVLGGARLLQTLLLVGKVVRHSKPQRRGVAGIRALPLLLPDGNLGTSVLISLRSCPVKSIPPNESRRFLVAMRARSHVTVSEDD